MNLFDLQAQHTSILIGALEKVSGYSDFSYVEILVCSAYENPLLLREVHMIDGTMLIMFLDRRNSENSRRG